MATRRDLFTAVRSEGALLPGDFLQQLIEPKPRLDGVTPDAYHLASGEKLNEAVSRTWNRLLGVWTSFQAASGTLKEGDPGTTVTRERWLLPLFQELGYGRLQPAKALEVDGKAYPVSHLWQHTPIHLVGRNVDLDRRTPGVAGAARTSPHGLVQEFLNRSGAHLWGFVSNGLCLRILRDNKSLTRQAYVEFDLAAMMDGQAYADFALLWLLCHQSRVEAERPEHCWLENWAETAREQGTRALDQLRDGVERAIAALGRGFLKHSSNRALMEKLRAGTLSRQDYYRQLLRAVYRLIFLFVAEDRNLLLTGPSGSPARERYTRFYSVARLRTLAERRRGSQHSDLWQGLSLVFARLSSDTGCAQLGLPALGSFLWSDKATPDLNDCELANADLLDAVRALVFTMDRGIRRTIDYRNLGAEELGSVYESLLELHPDLNAEAGTFALQTAAGHERKTTGSYYTPTSLIECLLDSALDPVLDEAVRQPDPAKAILALRVCDPACGSGHFLIAAAHRIANRLAAVRTGDEEPSPEAVRTALRDVVGRCLYGVDLNPMAVELCKVNLWLEALEPGKPLSFLERHIQCGNSLLGATPALLEQGISDAAFEPIEGDDKTLCRDFKRRNKKERENRNLFLPTLEPWNRLGDLAAGLASLDNMPDDTIEGIRAKQRRWEELVRSVGYEFGRLWADAWCAAFVWKKVSSDQLPYPITEEVFRTIERNPMAAPEWMRNEIRRLADDYQFFHWHLAFPEVFHVPTPAQGLSLGTTGNELPAARAGWLGGFDVVLGNPPWERIKLQEKEWFADRRPDVTDAPNAAARKRLIEALKVEDPALYASWLNALRRSDGESALVRNSGRYPLCGRGDINTYAIFAELMSGLLSQKGRLGCVVPTGIATDDTTKLFFQQILKLGHLVSLFDFENRKPIFKDVQGNQKFCLLSLANSPQSQFLVAAQLDEPSLVRDPARTYMLTGEMIRYINPNTMNCPTFRTRRDADLVGLVHRRIPVFILEIPILTNPWRVAFDAMFHMANDSGLFHQLEESLSSGWHLSGGQLWKGNEVLQPVYEAKLVGAFNHRAATFERTPRSARFKIHAGTNEPTLTDLQDPTYSVLPRYWVDNSVVQGRRKLGRGWTMGFRNAISAVADSRSLVVAVMPYLAVGHSLPVILCELEPPLSAALLALLNSFVVDYVLRQKASGGNLKFYILRQLPVVPPSAFEPPASWSREQSLADWVRPRVLELVYTAWDLEPFARDVGYNGPPFRWDPERRFKLRAELDAAFFHLYGIARDDVDYIMDTFPIVRKNDEKAFGEYRTKRLILEVYDRMQHAIDAGTPYETILDPRPADVELAHPRRLSGTGDTDDR